MKESFFGAMLDMSRNAVMKVEELKRYIDLLKKFGYDTLMLYTEDTYEIEGEKFFGYLRGGYKKSELKEIDKYCKERGITLIPCIQTLAHLDGIFKWGAYSDINDTANILLAEEEKTYKLIDKMFATVEECFTTKDVHIGMDEAHNLGLGKYLDKHGFTDRTDIFLRHLNKVCELASKHGLKPMMWSDMFFRLVSHGEYYDKDAKIDKGKLKLIPKGLTLVYWDYYHDDEKFYTGMIKAHKELCSSPVFAGGVWKWTGFAPANGYTLKTMKPAINSCRKNGINKIIMTMWGDDGAECSFYSVISPLFALKRLYDGEKSMPKIKAEFKEITGENFDDFMKLDSVNDIFEGKNQNFNPSKTILFGDLFNCFTETAFKEGGKEEYKKISKKLAAMKKRSVNYGYIFETQKCLADVCAIKYCMGLDIRKAYYNKDKEGLKNIVSEIKKLEKAIEKFYRAFKYQWFKENNPQGFDVQDLRIGGLKQRILYAKETLTGYIDGKIDKIPELDEKLEDYFCGIGEEKRLFGNYCVRGNITVNNL